MHRHDVLAFVPTIGILVAMGIQGCAERTAEEAKEHTVRKVPAEPSIPALETEAEKRTDAIAETKEDFERTLKRNLGTLDEQIRGLKDKAGDVKEAAKARWAETIADLDAKREAAEAKLDEVGTSAGDAWEHLRDGARSAWKELDAAVRRAQEEF